MLLNTLRLCLVYTLLLMAIKTFRLCLLYTCTRLLIVMNAIDQSMLYVLSMLNNTNSDDKQQLLQNNICIKVLINGMIKLITSKSVITMVQKISILIPSIDIVDTYFAKEKKIENMSKYENK